MITTTMMETVLRIGHEGTRTFFAGVVLQNGIVVETAPIMKRMHGWRRDRVEEYCAARGWSVEVVQQCDHVKVGT